MVDIPEALGIETVPVSELPSKWRRYDPPVGALHTIGDSWVKRGRTAILKVPSAVVPSESNYLLNPLHADFHKLTPGRPAPMTLDPRLRQ